MDQEDFVRLTLHSLASFAHGSLGRPKSVRAAAVLGVVARVALAHVSASAPASGSFHVARGLALEAALVVGPAGRGHLVRAAAELGIRAGDHEEALVRGIRLVRLGSWGGRNWAAFSIVALCRSGFVRTAAVERSLAEIRLASLLIRALGRGDAVRAALELGVLARLVLGAA